MRANPARNGGSASQEVDPFVASIVAMESLTRNSGPMCLGPAAQARTPARALRYMSGAAIILEIFFGNIWKHNVFKRGYWGVQLSDSK